MDNAGKEKGGHARAAKLTPERRREIAMIANTARWAEKPAATKAEELSVGNKCPYCQHNVSAVVDSRANKYGIRRRRKCKKCGRRWSTQEMDIAQTESYFAKDIALAKAVRKLVLNGIPAGSRKLRIVGEAT